MKRPLSVIIIAGLFIAAGTVGLVYHATEFKAAAPFQYDLVLVCLVRLFAIICGIFMLRGCNWARWGLLGWIAYHVILSAFHSLKEVVMHAVLFAIVAFFLLRPRVSAFFRVFSVVVFLWGVSFAFGGAGPVLRVGDMPPPLTLSKIVQGPTLEEVTWEKLKGKVVVLEFWNTACVPCVEAIPHLNELVEQFNTRQVVFLCVSDDNPDHLKRFLAKKPIKGWLALDAPFKPTETAFGVVGIPHTVIVDSSGKIAALTHPRLLKAQHLEEILAGRPSTLPTNIATTAEAPVVAVAKPPPRTIEISISGPFPQPDGAFDVRNWEAGIFHAEKAPLSDVLAAFFDVSPKLISGQGELPEGLYDVSAAAPPEQVAELKRGFIEAVREKWGLTVELINRDVSVYALTVSSTNAPGLKAVQKRAGGGEKPGGFYLGGNPIGTIASYLENCLDKTVVDETGLQGLWAADVRWEMSESELAAGAKPDPGKVIKAAREQLGLDLRPTLRTRSVLEIHKSK